MFCPTSGYLLNLDPKRQVASCAVSGYERSLAGEGLGYGVCTSGDGSTSGITPEHAPEPPGGIAALASSTRACWCVFALFFALGESHVSAFSAPGSLPMHPIHHVWLTQSCPAPRWAAAHQPPHQSPHPAHAPHMHPHAHRHMHPHALHPKSAAPKSCPASRWCCGPPALPPLPHTAHVPPCPPELSSVKVVLRSDMEDYRRRFALEPLVKSVEAEELLKGRKRATVG